MTKADDPQFTIVEYGKICGFTIYGIYIQTTGPSDKPKFAINRKRPNNINRTEREGWELLRRNPIPMIKLIPTAASVPACKTVFLPILANTNELIMVVTTCSKLMIEGKIGLNYFKFPYAMYPA